MFRLSDMQEVLLRHVKAHVGKMSLLEAIRVAGGPILGAELWLLFVRSQPAVRLEVVRVAEKLARDRLLAMEDVRDAIGPHVPELAELERAWAVLAHALEEVGE